MISIDGLEEAWFRDWHKIMPDQSHYIRNMHNYCQLQDAISIPAQKILLKSNDSLTNHTLDTYILQGPEYEFTTGPRFIRWLKKKIFGTHPSEILRIVFDDKYYTNILLDAAVCRPTEELIDFYTPTIERLIMKAKNEHP